mgnify:CR=1 FL=1
MRFFVTFFTLIWIISSTTLAQNFNFSSDTLTQHGQPGETIVLHANIVNLSQQELQLLVERSENLLPDGWTSSLCGGELCFPPFRDSYTIPDPTLGIPALSVGDTSEFHLNFYTNQLADVGQALVRVVNLSDTTEFQELMFTASTQSVRVSDEKIQLSQSFRLHQNYPNPFNPTTTISFEIANTPGIHTRLTIYNSTGQIVATLLNKKLSPGNHEVNWNAMDQSGNPIPSGIYLIELRSGAARKMSKMMLIR